MTDQPDKLDLRSHDLAEDKRQELLRLFPEIRTEGGQLDFEWPMADSLPVRCTQTGACVLREPALPPQE